MIIQKLLTILILCIYGTLANSNLKNVRRNRRSLTSDFISLIQRHSGYTAEEHNVLTEDGYNLTLHRISGSPKYPKAVGKLVVYIQHGLYLSSDAYVQKGPEKDLAFLLADKGYDVWLGNARGNKYSRSHKQFSIDDSEFWDFSFNEIGRYDLKASIDYVLQTTGSFFLTFVGFSIGATESYILLSHSTEYNYKINLLISISPLAFWQNSTKVNLEVEDVKKTLNVENYVPVGQSDKVLSHLLQIMKSGKFQEFKRSDDDEPELYNLARVTVANGIFVGDHEEFIYPKDVDALKNKFSTSIIYKIRNPDSQSGVHVTDLDNPSAANINYLYASVASLIQRFL